MSNPFVGEVRLVGFNFQPNGWNYCNGALIAISQNDVLFNLIGTTYGGDGQQTFALPDLQGRVPVHQGQLLGGGNYVIGQKAGTETVTITSNQYPLHNHPVVGTTQSQGNVASPNNNLPAAGQNIYRTQAPAVGMVAGMLSNDGGSQPHSNQQPFLVLNWVISMFGIFPSQ